MKRRCFPLIFGVTLIAVSRLSACANPCLPPLRVAHTHVVLARNGLHGLATVFGTVVLASSHPIELREVLRRRVALAPVPAFRSFLQRVFFEDHVVGDVLLAGRLHRLFHQDVRLTLQASRVASGCILRHERLMLLPPTCHGWFSCPGCPGRPKFCLLSFASSGVSALRWSKGQCVTTRP